MAEMTYIQAISDALRLEMRRDPRVFILGEDVGVYGGAFKVSLGFQEEFGPWRVIDTPLSETAIVEDPNPVLFFEHKHLYRRIKGEVPEDRYTVPFGSADVHRAGDDATVITWGAMVYTATEAAGELAKDGFEVEVVDLRTLIPWDKERVLEGVRRCSKVLVLHEDTRTAGFGAEIAATIAEEAFEHLDAPVMRVAAPDMPVPFSPPLEKAYIPQVDDVVNALRELAAY